jgi:hypothetical protein
MRERPTDYRARDTDFWSRLTLASAEGFFTCFVSAPMHSIKIILDGFVREGL